jgi:hypothetical protein
MSNSVVRPRGQSARTPGLSPGPAPQPLPSPSPSGWPGWARVGYGLFIVAGIAALAYAFYVAFTVGPFPM